MRQVRQAGGAAPTLDSVQAAPEQNTQKAATQTVQASASNNSSYTVNASVLHVRAGSDTSHDVISRVYNGQSLNVIGEENGWFKINVNGQTGFVSGEFVSKNGATNNNEAQVETIKLLLMYYVYVQLLTLLVLFQDVYMKDKL